MIARLTGTLLEIDRTRLLIAADASLVYEVLIPAYLADPLTPQLGSPITLETIHYLEQQGQGTSYIPRLLGFPTLKDKAFFETFVGVKGLGNKRALRALAMPPQMIARMIAEGDARALTRLPEIGKKLADTIILELKDAVDEFLDWSASASATVDPASPAPSPTKKTRSAKSAPSTSPPIVESKPNGQVTGSNPVTVSAAPDTFLASRAASRAAVETLITLGEQPLEAERLVAKVLDAARRDGHQPPTQPETILTLAYAAKRG